MEKMQINITINENDCDGKTEDISSLFVMCTEKEQNLEKIK